ncbi:MAG TPA: HDOD domain-containing protein [Gammaproteobacteria bacterium]|nr:HDOD domain-containing protein [Gammaproteobacteria bacterium]
MGLSRTTRSEVDELLEELGLTGPRPKKQLAREVFAAEVRREIECLAELPTMPETARLVLRLRNDRSAGVKQLAAAVENDPGLAAQMVCYARLPLFGYGDRINSVQKAIGLVLGFDQGVHMALGMTAGRNLRMPGRGPLGREAYWRHALYSATLTQTLGERMPRERRPSAGTTYLAGLLHNIGYLLLGHLHPEEFSHLNAICDSSPLPSVRDLELQVLGVRHELLGTWLLKSWEMPPEVIVAAREHHFPDYGGEHATYAKLVLLADRALALRDITMSGERSIPEHVVDELGLDMDQVLDATETLFGMGSELDDMAEKLAA